MTILTRRIPLSVGNLVEIVGLLAATYLSLLARQTSAPMLSFLIYLLALGGFVFFPHCLTHYVVGRLVGIRFRYYSVGRSSISKLRLGPLAPIALRVPVLTLNTDRESLRSVTRGKRRAMFMSGAIASMTLPLLVAISSIGSLPIFLSVLLLLIAVGNLSFDAYYSPRAGDFSRAKSNPPVQ